MTSVHYLSRNEIDNQRWDHRVTDSVNGLIYARTAYLDLLAKKWDALVTDDYTCIMPLIGKAKFGTRYLYQPPFCQQLGIIGECSEPLQQAFLDKAMELFPFAEINLNFKNWFQGFSHCNNFIINLQEDYASISGGYSTDLKKNLQRCSRLPLQYQKGANIDESITLYRENYGRRFPQVTIEHYHALGGFCRQYPEHCMLREVRTDGRLLSTALCLVDERRIYFLASTTLPEGRDMEANHFLVDSLIREFSGQQVLLDFEGSDIPGITAFYENFGAKNQQYPHVRWNKLKWPWSMLKK
jgi:hypothetical protein